MKRGIKGITLIALVVTIVVLLILSAVAIGLSIGDNGIIKQAQDATDRWKEGSQQEQNALGDLAYFINSSTQGPQELSVTVSQTENSFTIKVELEEENPNMEYEYYVDGELKSKTNSNEYTQEVNLEEKEPYIPTGFTHTTGEVDSGYVIKDTNNGNEFVWVPVAGKKYTVYVKASDGRNNYQSDEIEIAVSELTRTLKSTRVTYDNWYEEEGDVQDKKSIAYFKKSVAENGGFYMGRYEMGMPGQKSGDEPTLDFTNEARNIKGTPVCVAEVMPWTNIDYDVAKENIESMYNGEVQSAMLNSYARTTTFNWLGGTIGNYNDTFWYDKYSIKGSCYVVGGDISVSEGYNYFEEYIKGESITYAGSMSTNAILLVTGAKLLNNNNQETSFVSNNIYDLGGNAGEWSTEMLKSDNSHRISGRSFRDLNGDGWIDGNASMYKSGATGDISTSSRPILYK